MDPIFLRFIERLAAVVIGGIAIYLGYRLFLTVPDQRDSSGKLDVLNASVVLTHVGPGVFFALFGAVVVAVSLARPALQITQSGENLSKVYATGEREPESRADGRAQLRREMAFLNSVPSELSQNLPAYERESINREIARVKITLMRPVWGTPQEGFGEFSEFERWAVGGEREPPPAGMQEALKLYRYGRNGGPS